jgi:hypothetical protein
LNFSKSGLTGGIDSFIDSVMDTGSKGSRSSIYVRMHCIRDAHCRHSGSKCTVGLIEDLVRQVWRIRIQISTNNCRRSSVNSCTVNSRPTLKLAGPYLPSPLHY